MFVSVDVGEDDLYSGLRKLLRSMMQQTRN